jgi:hypothetical protein
MQTASERLKHELRDAIADLHADLDRIEILAAVLCGFSAPVPDYEPTFRHISLAPLQRYEIGGEASRKW